MNRHHLTEEYLDRVSRFAVSFPSACTFLRRIQDEGPAAGLWLSTAVNAHLYKDSAFLVYLKLKNPELKPPSLVLSPKFHQQIAHGTTDQSSRVFPTLLKEILGHHGGLPSKWATRLANGAFELTAQAPSPFFDALANALMRRA